MCSSKKSNHLYLLVLSLAATTLGACIVQHQPSSKERVSRLLTAGIKLEEVDENGGTILHWSAGRNENDLVQAILEKGIDVNTKDKRGMTALHMAALSISDNNDMVKILVKAGADVTATDRNGFTPLHCAAYEGHFNIIVALIEAGANVGSKSTTGSTAYDISVANGISDEKLLKLLSADSDFD